MAETIDSLQVSFGADFSALLKEMRAAEKASGEFRGRIEKEMTLARQAFDKIEGSIKTFSASFVAGLQTAAVTGAVALLTAGFEALSAGTDKARLAQERLNALQEAGKKITEELATASGEAAEFKKTEALATIALAESELTRLSIQRQRLRDEMRESRLASSAMSLKGRADAIDDLIEKETQRLKVTKQSIAAAEEQARILQGMRTTGTGAKPDTKPTTTAATATPGESWLVREAWAAIQATRGLDEYEARTRELLTLQQAELSGNRELVALLELQQQLRKQHGPDFVKTQQERIAALAQERGEMERQAEMQRRIYGELQAAGSDVKAALGDSLKAVFKGGAEGAEMLRNAWARALDSMSTRLMNFALDSAWDAIRQQMKSLQSGENGGVLGMVLGFVGKAVGAGLGSLGGADYSGAVNTTMAGGTLAPGFYGFASGGSFTVPGTGGTDTSRIGFMATPGERVTVETPQQVRRGGSMGGGSITIVGMPDDKIEIGQLKEGLRAMGIYVREVNRSIEQKAVSAVRQRAWGDANYLPR